MVGRAAPSVPRPDTNTHLGGLCEFQTAVIVTLGDAWDVLYSVVFTPLRGIYEYRRVIEEQDNCMEGVSG